MNQNKTTIFPCAGNPISLVRLHLMRVALERVGHRSDWNEVRCGETPGLYFLRAPDGDTLVAYFRKRPSRWTFRSMTQFLNDAAPRPEAGQIDGKPSVQKKENADANATPEK